VSTAVRAIRAGEMDLVLAGGVEPISRAPYVMCKAGSALSRDQKIEDTSNGWHFMNPLMKKQYAINSMPETAENVAKQFKYHGKTRTCLRSVPSKKPLSPKRKACSRRRSWIVNDSSLLHKVY